MSTPARPHPRDRPARGSELELTVDRLAYGGNGVARREDGYVVFVAGAVPGDRVRAVVGKAKRAYAEARAVEVLEPSPDRIEPVADHPGAPWQVLPYERQLAVKQEQVDDALTPHRPARGLRARADRAGARAVALPQQARVLLRRGARRRAGVRLPRARPLRRDRPADGLHARLRALQRRRASRCSPCCREQGLGAWDRRTQQGFLRNLVVREGRRTGQLQVRLVTSPGKLDADALIEAVDSDGLFWTQTAGLGESTQGGETDAARRARRSCTSSSATCAS